MSRERVFENAYLEYGSMESMTEPTGRKLFFLTDPIEDWPRDWADYRVNYQATFTAQLLYPPHCQLRGDAVARPHLRGAFP